MLFPPFRSRAARRRPAVRNVTRESVTPCVSALEPLESRRLLAANPGATAAINAGVLDVAGTRRADEIRVELNGTSGQIDVTINGAAAGSFAPADATGGLRVLGGGGNDTVVVGAGVPLRAELRGGKGNDSLTGGGESDDIDGEAGRDSADGGAGDDDVRGGPGNDNVSGGAGTDNVHGDGGKDVVRGGDGNDDLDGGAGNDDCDGEAGDDRVTGERGRDRVRGGLGDDTVDGGSGGDDLGGDDGNDHVRGDDGRDVCDGGSGDDDLDGGRGRDRVRGGTGRDSFDDAFDDDHDRDDEHEDRGADDDQPVPLDQLPAAVRIEFDARFPGVTIREIERETEDTGVVYKIDFLNAQGQRVRAEFTEAGQFVEQEMRDAALTVGAGHHEHHTGTDDGTDDGEHVGVDQLPAAVRSAFDAQFAGATVREVEREVEHGGVVWKIDFTNTQGQRFRAEYTEAGQFIRHEVHEGGGDDNGTGGGHDNSGSGSGGGDDGSSSGGHDDNGSGSGSGSGSGGDDLGGSDNSGSGSSGGGGEAEPGDDHGSGGHGSDDGAGHN